MDKYSRWNTQCPVCGENDCLFVISFEVNHIPTPVYTYSELETDGFIIPERIDTRGAGTTNEQVQCSKCFSIFDLHEVQIPEGPVYTVFGIHMDTSQIFAESLRAETPEEAAKKIFEKVDNSDFGVVDVLEGDHQGLLQNPYLLDREDLEVLLAERAKIAPNKSLAPDALLTCSICNSPCNVNTAHLHQGKYIGDECCWDERLKGSE